LRVFALAALSLLLLACSSKGGASPEEDRVAGESGSSAAAVSVASVTPQARLALPTATATLAPSPTFEPSATPVPPTDTPIPPTATPTPTPTATFTPSPTPTPTNTPTPTPTPTPIVVDGITLSDREQQLFAAHNQIRDRLGIAPLRLNAILMDIARGRAKTMADTSVFSHYNPNGDTIFDLLDDAGYEWGDATENIHYNNVSSGAVSFAMAEYRKSPAHYANIINPGFRRVGIGFVTSSSGVHYISVVFTD
jgi:uncharacterized protein YkwD